MKKEINLFKAHEIRNIVEDFVEEELKNGQFEKGSQVGNVGKGGQGGAGDEQEEDE